MAEIKNPIKGELTISPDAFNTLVKVKEELEDLIILHKFEHRKEVYK
jgi:hypothetical protein